MPIIEALEQAIATTQDQLSRMQQAMAVLKGVEAPLRRDAPPLAIAGDCGVPQGGEDLETQKPAPKANTAPALTKPFREAKKAAAAVEVELEGVVIAVSPLQKQMIMALADAEAPVTRAALAEQLGTSVATVADHITKLNTGALLTTTCIIKSYHNGMTLEQRA